MLQDKYVACGFVEAAAVLVSGADRKLHKGGLVTLNALLARSRFFFVFFLLVFYYSLNHLLTLPAFSRSSRGAQDRLHHFLVRAREHADAHATHAHADAHTRGLGVPPKRKKEAEEEAEEKEAFAPRGQELLRNIADILESGGRTLQRYKLRTSYKRL